MLGLLASGPWWLRIRLQCKRAGLDPWVGKIPWRRKWLPTPVFLPGKAHGQGSLAGYSPGGGKESDRPKQQQQPEKPRASEGPSKLLRWKVYTS